ncbi:MocR-like pyridoxine biosynthesis transcription factor PdxR [Levilactobacillus huananensis]|uniref:MocR-like pyridoxine biosynthesis transcription factor PdxR n=1 Tax=Levilactobacillus huananensis TaxID=2486019 RepID=UPI000F79D5FC|nr:PLP-dependent aminotransferase family protein [Levilactobacillus huananensis]
MYFLQEKGSLPLYEQLIQQLSAAMDRGELTGKLPSIRSLATELAVSKGTVENAYEQLVAEDRIENRPQQGFFVKTPLVTSSMVSEHDRDLVQPDFDFSLGYAASLLETHAKTAWKRSLERAIQDQDRRDPQTAIRRQGSLALREEIVALLARRRGMHCQPEQVVITAGNSASLVMVTQLMQDRFQSPLKVGFENPGYRSGLETIRRQGGQPVLIPVEETTGMDVDRLRAEPVNLVYVTPSHQFPLGPVMPLANRQSLLAVMRTKQGLIIEDDYDSEFSVSMRPMPALASLDAQRVIYLGGFSKSISTELRLSFMVLPPQLVASYQKVFAYENNGVAAIIQAATAEFLASGAYSRHITRALRLNRRKYAFLQEQLTPFVQRGLISARFGEAGIHLVFRLKRPQETTKFDEILERRHLYLRKMDQYWLQDKQPGYYIVGFAHFALPKFRQGVAKLVLALKELSA